eukprot:1157525-Pelagomonas_calceolata.AAC.10
MHATRRPALGRCALSCPAKTQTVRLTAHSIFIADHDLIRVPPTHLLCEGVLCPALFAQPGLHCQADCVLPKSQGA